MLLALKGIVYSAEQTVKKAAADRTPLFQLAGCVAVVLGLSGIKIQFVYNTFVECFSPRHTVQRIFGATARCGPLLFCAKSHSLQGLRTGTKSLPWLRQTQFSLSLLDACHASRCPPVATGLQQGVNHCSGDSLVCELHPCKGRLCASSHVNWTNKIWIPTEITGQWNAAVMRPGLFSEHVLFHRLP